MTKSVVTASQGCDNDGSGMIVPCWACFVVLIQWDSLHLVMYFRTVASIMGQWISRDTNSVVLRAPEWPECGLSWKMLGSFPE